MECFIARLHWFLISAYTLLSGDPCICILHLNNLSLQAVEKAKQEADASAAKLAEAQRQATQVQKARQEGDLSSAEEKKALEKLRAEQEAASAKERAAIDKLKTEQQAQSSRERAAIEKFKAEQEELLERERASIAQLKAQQEAEAAKFQNPEAKATPDPDTGTLIKPSPTELPTRPPPEKFKESSSPFGALVSPFNPAADVSFSSKIFLLIGSCLSTYSFRPLRSCVSHYVSRRALCDHVESCLSKHLSILFGLETFSQLLPCSFQN